MAAASGDKTAVEIKAEEQHLTLYDVNTKTDHHVEQEDYPVRSAASCAKILILAASGTLDDILNNPDNYTNHKNTKQELKDMLADANLYINTYHGEREAALRAAHADDPNGLSQAL
jgi:hypothetical protein